MSKTPAEVQKLKQQIVDTSILIAGILGLISYVSYWTLLTDAPFRWSSLPDIGMVMVLFLIYGFRRYIPLTWKTALIVVGGLIVTYLDVAKFGLLASNQYLFIGIGFIGAVAFNLRVSVVIFGFMMAGFLLIGHAIIQGDIVVNYAHMQHDVHFGNWITRAILMTLVFSVITFFMKRYMSTVDGLIIDLNARQADLAMSNERLEEKVRKRTAKLEVLNVELADQNRKLEQTLSELKDTQEQLIHSEKMASIGVLSAGVGHEINNPLNFIRGALDGLQKQIHKLPEKYREPSIPFLHVAEEGVQRSHEIVKSLASFSRKTTAIDEVVDIHEILESCLHLIFHETKNRIEIVKEFHSDPLSTVGNSGKLNQVFLNLLVNATQSIEETGTITIRTETRAKYNLVYVKDTGHGIPPELINRIMDPFFTTKEPGKGTGLGLSITFNILKEHGGHIEFSSKVAKGTEVLVSLPKAKS